MTRNPFATRPSARLAASALVAVAFTLLCAPGAKAATIIRQSTCPVIINQPGVYILGEDLHCPATDGIYILSSGVTLFLAGHSITGAAEIGTCNVGFGIRVGPTPAPISRVAVVGPGAIRNFRVSFRADTSSQSVAAGLTAEFKCQPWPTPALFTRAFVIFTPSSEWTLLGNRVRDLEAGGLNSSGILLMQANKNLLLGNDVNNTIIVSNSSDNYVIWNKANDDGRGILVTGVSGSHRNKISRNTTNNNNRAGGMTIDLASTANTITENTSFDNQPFDLEDRNPNCDSNVWKDNDFEKANQDCIQ
jgi:hypothetical protein